MLRSQEHSHIAARNVRPLELSREQVGEFATLAALGVGLDSYHLDLMVSAYNRMGGFGMDAITAPVMASSAAVPVQFLQTWLPGFVRTLTTARTIDELFGISTVGSFDDEEVVQGVLEYTGHAVPYTDHGNIPLASYGTGYEKRTVVRFEHGMGVGVLEQSRAARQGLDLASERRAGAMLALEIIRNKVGFYGYNSGGATYGALNEPNLPAYVNVAPGAGGGTEWSTKTFLEITADIRGILSELSVASGGNIKVKQTPITLGVALEAAQYLSVTNELGTSSVMEWLNKTYPNVRVVEVPEFDNANGGASVMYAYAETVEDGSSDDRRTVAQLVPSKFQTLGIDQGAKRYVEDFLNATAGILVKRPYAIRRRSGI
jgi:hypothetical protein